LSYATNVKDRQSSRTGKKTHSYNNNEPAIKSSNNNNSLLQPKLRISQPGDVYEQEADRVAEKVMAMSSMPFSYSAIPSIGDRSKAKGKEIDKKCTACQMKGQQENIEISRKLSYASNLEASDQVTNEIINNILSSSSGSSLDANTLNFMGLKFGHDFSKVRIHTNSKAAASADSINAAAYTVGNDIVFAHGEYSPSSARGKRLLAHEFTHVVQQSGSDRRSRVDLTDSKYSASLSQPTQAYSANMSIMARLIQRAPKTTLEANTSESERGNLQVPVMKQVAALSQAEIEEIMNDRAPTRLAGVKDVKFSAEIATPQIRLGLEALAAKLFGNGGLDPNSVTYIKLDLSKFGGVNGVYRFTLIERTAKSKEKKQQLIIEQVSTSPPAGPDKIDVTAEEKRIAKFELQLGNEFKSNDSKKKQLLSALACVKDPILERIKGTTFILDPKAVGPQNDNARYDPNTHTLTIFGSAFSTFLTSADVGGSDFFTHAVVHEIGHTIDFEPYLQAKRKVAKLEQQLKDARNVARKVTIDKDAAIIDDDKKK
jgi:hypothetical protein